MQEALISGVNLLIGALVIPYIVWTVTSIFSMRQEIALMKAELQNSKDIYHLLKERLT